ncbi:hypothetical protein TNCV_1155421, partial [Trichonephila clavipes]
LSWHPFGDQIGDLAAILVTLFWQRSGPYGILLEISGEAD